MVDGDQITLVVVPRLPNHAESEVGYTIHTESPSQPFQLCHPVCRSSRTEVISAKAWVLRNSKNLQ